MEYTAKYRFARVAPRKAGLVAGLVRGRGLNEAYTLLRTARKKSAVFVHKLLDSAQHNATDRNPNVDPDRLFVKEIVVGRGPTFKRFRARAKGRGNRILKRTSHFRVVLAERADAVSLKRPARVKQAPRKEKPA